MKYIAHIKVFTDEGCDIYKLEDTVPITKETVSAKFIQKQYPEDDHTFQGWEFCQEPKLYKI